MCGARPSTLIDTVPCSVGEATMCPDVAADQTCFRPSGLTTLQISCERACGAAAWCERSSAAFACYAAPVRRRTPARRPGAACFMYERNTAFIRVWYFGPRFRNHVNTSSSTRSDIACLATGMTSSASSQKSLGKFASSGGDVRAISTSRTIRSRARSARPRLGTSAAFDRLLVRLALTTMTPTG